MKVKNSDIGLVLSGGGHKGIAHAGVLKFLEEQEIKPKIIAGTSAGSIVGSLYLSGMKPDAILTFFKSIDFLSWNHLTFRKAGILDSNTFRKYLETVFKDKTIADLDKEMLITATDLEEGTTTFFNKETRLLDAVLASSAFPGVISPVSINGKLYSDGGILNNFPAMSLKNNCDFIIGINLYPFVTSEAKKLTTIKSVSLRTYEIILMHASNSNSTLCDWYIEPKELTKYNTFEFKKMRMDEIFQIGYNEAKRTFDTIQDKI